MRPSFFGYGARGNVIWWAWQGEVRKGDVVCGGSAFGGW